MLEFYLAELLHKLMNLRSNVSNDQTTEKKNEVASSDEEYFQIRDFGFTKSETESESAKSKPKVSFNVNQEKDEQMRRINEENIILKSKLRESEIKKDELQAELQRTKKVLDRLTNHIAALNSQVNECIAHKSNLGPMV